MLDAWANVWLFPQLSVLAKTQNKKNTVPMSGRLFAQNLLKNALNMEDVFACLVFSAQVSKRLFPHLYPSVSSALYSKYSHICSRRTPKEKPDRQMSVVAVPPSFQRIQRSSWK